MKNETLWSHLFINGENNDRSQTPYLTNKELKLQILLQNKIFKISKSENLTSNVKNVTKKHTGK